MSSCARLLAILLSTVAAVVRLPAASATTHLARTGANQHAIAQQIKAGRVGQVPTPETFEWTGSVRIASLEARQRVQRRVGFRFDHTVSGRRHIDDIGIIVTKYLDALSANSVAFQRLLLSVDGCARMHLRRQSRTGADANATSVALRWISAVIGDQRAASVVNQHATAVKYVLRLEMCERHSSAVEGDTVR